MEQILLAYGIPKETVAAITILYRNTKVKVRSPHGDAEYFDIVAGVLQGDTLAPYLFIICGIHSSIYPQQNYWGGSFWIYSIELTNILHRLRT